MQSPSADLAGWPRELVYEVFSLGPILSRETFAAPRRRRRKVVVAARRKPYKGSKAAKRASRPRRKPTRRQRWAARDCFSFACTTNA